MPIYSRLKILAAEKELRDGEKVTLQAIADGAELPLTTIARYMTPKRVTRFEAETLEKLCDYFDCDVGDLLTYVPKNKKKASE